MASKKASIFNKSFVNDSTVSQRLQDMSNLHDVEKIIALRDIGPSNSETPGSVAVATKNIVYPEFCSNVVNCGMSILKTGIHKNALSKDFMQKFCSKLDFKTSNINLQTHDITQMLDQGANYVLDKWDCNPNTLYHIENCGNMFRDTTRKYDINELVPPWILRHPKSQKHTPLPSLAGNHFIEFQSVDEILDKETAAEWGLDKNEVVVFMHGDYPLTLYINWHYANRFKFRNNAALLDKIKLQTSKATFHLSSGKLRDTPHQWNHYNNKNRFTGLDTRKPIGERYIEANRLAMNFGYANRLLANMCIRDVLDELNPKTSYANLLWDVGHDTINRETIDGEDYWIHRKAAGNAVSDKPAIVSGSYNMDSFLGKSLPTAEPYLNSYDHGSSNVIEWFESNKELESTENTTQMYSLTSETMEDEVTHINRRPIETVVDTLVENGILSSVAWLRPMANIGK